MQKFPARPPRPSRPRQRPTETRNRQPLSPRPGEETRPSRESPPSPPSRLRRGLSLRAPRRRSSLAQGRPIRRRELLRPTRRTHRDRAKIPRHRPEAARRHPRSRHARPPASSRPVRRNARVRVLHTILEPHLKSPMHEHPHYVVVYITELHTTMVLGDGKAVDNPRHPGEISWRDFMKLTETVRT